MIRPFFQAAVLALMFGSLVQADEAGNAPALTASHKQIETFKPTREGKAIHLNTFCLDRDSNILTCVTTPDGDEKYFVQVYSPKLELLREYRLPFDATAINVAQDGTIFIAGNGQIAKISTAGELLDVKDTPNIGDRSDLKERLTKLAQENWDQYSKAMQSQVDAIQARIAKLEEKSAEDRSARDNKRLLTLQEQKKVYEDSMTQTKEYMTNPDQLMSQAFNVTALAVNSKDVFISCSGIETQGYEVWRMNHDFSEPTQVLSGQSGCCGQFDIQADDEHLILAENTKFKVGLLDRDGNRKSDFGQSNRMGGDGFGSCCNPMNVRCCSNGDILTAESSIGTIKRYDKEGNLQSVVGKAKIGGGCKHVPLGYDSERDRYYIMYQDRSAICVLVPQSEAPEFTADELLAKEARGGLGTKLVGQWSLNGKMPPLLQAQTIPVSNEDTGDEAEETAVEDQDPFLMALMDFQENGTLVTNQSQLGWECVRQADGTLFIAMDLQGTAYDLKVEFSGDDEISISVLLGDQVYSTKKYLRIKDSTSSPVPAESTVKQSAAETSGGDQ